VDPNIVNAYAHFWSLAFERQFGGDNLVSIEYSGSAGRKLYSISQFNFPGEAALLLGNPDPNSRLNPQYSTINTRGNGGRSNYNAFIFSARGNNFRNWGLQYTANYTLGWAKDNLSTTFTEGAYTPFLGFMNPYDPSLDYAYADFDVRHRFVGSLNWDLPLGRGDTGWKRHALNGWTIAGIFTARTGTPFTIYDSTNAVSAHPPRLVPNGTLATVVFDTGQPNTFNYIDLTGQPVGAFINPVCQCSDLGPYPPEMTGRNQFRTPGIWNLDTALYKTFRITERANIQLRAEVFNIFNHSNLYVLAGTNDVSNGLIPAARGVTPNSPQSNFFERRNVQLAIKLNF
jgi:hypothetical protein